MESAFRRGSPAPRQPWARPIFSLDLLQSVRFPPPRRLVSAAARSSMPSPASRRSDGERQPQSPGADHCDSDGQTEKEVDKLFRHGTWRTRAAAASAERGPISAAAAGRGALVHDDCGK
jgi:hypothetical protein